MQRLDGNDEILIRESPTDKEDLIEICTHFNGPRKKCWRFLGTVKNKKKLSPLNYPHPSRGDQMMDQKLEKLTFTAIDIETFFLGSDLGTNILKN